MPWNCGSFGENALEHLHNSIRSGRCTTTSREIWSGEKVVEHEAELVEHFIAKEAHKLAEEARVVGSDIRHLRSRIWVYLKRSP